MEHPPAALRTFSTQSTSSLNSVSTVSSSRIVSSGPVNINNFNKPSTPKDHLFYRCESLKRKLQKIPGMEPFLNQAFNQAEQLSEQQALALAQERSNGNGHSNGKRHQSLDGAMNRLSVGSDSSSIQGSLTRMATNASTSSLISANISVDPATHLWKLFQQGAPFCVLINHILPDSQIPVVSSDDLRICKKSVDSGGGDEDVNMDVQITDERSKVFREIIETERKYVQDLELMCKYRQDLIEAENLSSEQIHLLFPNLNEIIDFQRRFLNGLECNINVPIRYQRIGSVFIHASLGPFNAYEPWTIGQLTAIDLINKEAANLKKSSSLLDPGFELQSYILKPIQRLCKYPLLLKELIKTSPEYSKQDPHGINEAQRRAENIEHLEKLKERVGNWRGFNLDAQGELLFHGQVGVKDAENEKEYVAYLFEKIVFFFTEIDDNKKSDKQEKKSKFSTRKRSTSSNLRRVYISEIYNISAPNTPGSTLIISWSGRKESGSFTLRYRSEEARNQWEKCLRDLKTNEMNKQIHKKLRDSDSSFNTDDSAIYDYTGISTSPVNQSTQQQYYDHRGSHSSRHHSSSSTLSMMKNNRVKSGDLSRISSTSTTLDSFSNNLNGSPNTTNPSLTSSDATKTIPTFDVAIKLLYKSTELSEPLIVNAQIEYNDLLQKIISQIITSNLVADDVNISRLRYKDDEGDFVNLNSDDDWGLVLDMLTSEDFYQTSSNEKRSVTVWVS
ncbi:RhoGEF domain family protein [Candida albicans]|uniref:RhoGEF domain family protein n=1 Tax=Candida albicans TaxID=5476 RepID=A0A8H6BSC8_CANAX|nr:RhoGEF domain family protein [Candida albicans]